jgi:hypothetical protein
MATELDVEWRLDEDLVIDVIVNGLSGEAINISSLTLNDLQWGISVNKDSAGDRLVTLAIGSGITITSGAAGQARVRLAASSQDDLEENKTYYHEFRAVTADGTSIQFFGRAKVLKSIFATP